MLIVLDPPCRLTPILLRFLSLSSLDFFWPAEALNGGLPGDKVFCRSSKSESSDAWSSENGNRPSASSIRETPSDQTSDLTVYCAPWIRSGCVPGPMRTHQLNLHEEHLKDDSAHTHVSRCTNKGVSNRVNQLSGYSEITDLDLTLRVEEDI